MTGQRPTRAGLALVAFLAAGHGLLLAALVPPLHGPDEPAHFDYVQRIAEMVRLPRLQAHDCTPLSKENAAAEAAFVLGVKFNPDRGVPPLTRLAAPDPLDAASRSTTGCGPASPYPPLYYASAALAYRARAGGPLFERLFATRLVSVAWTVLAATFAFLLGLWWFGNVRDGVLVGVLFAAEPMIAFLSGVVNNDSAMFACAAGSFAAVALASNPERRRAALLLLAVCTTAGSLVKPTFTLVVPVLAACAVAQLGPRRLGSWGRAMLALAPSGIAAIAWAAYSEPASRDVLSRTVLQIGVREFVEQWVLNCDRVWKIWVRSYWMNWGWLDTWLSPAYYVAISAMLLLGAAGLAIRWRHLERRDRWVVALAAGGTAFVLTALYSIELQVLRTGMAFVQGRYLLPLYPLLLVALITGLRALTRAIGARVDAAWTFAGLLLLVDVAAVARLLTRYYA